MVMADVTAPEFLMPSTGQELLDKLKPRITFPVTVSVAGAEEFEIPCRPLLPSVLLFRILLLVMLSVPDAREVVFMPVKKDEPVPNAEQFCIVFPVMVIPPVAMANIPLILHVAVVVAETPADTELAVEASPIVFELMVKLPVPETSIGYRAYPLVLLPLADMAVMVFPLMVIAFVAILKLMPVTFIPVEFDVLLTVIAPVLITPMVLLVMVARPVVMYMPVKIPEPPVELAVVVKDIPAMVLPVTELLVTEPMERFMPT